MARHLAQYVSCERLTDAGTAEVSIEYRVAAHVVPESSNRALDGHMNAHKMTPAHIRTSIKATT